MKVLILGVAGYIGRALAKYLLERGYTVGGWDSEVKLRVAGKPLYLLPSTGEYRNVKNITAADLDGYDAVVHLAEIPSAPYSMSAPANGWFAIENNIHSTYALAQALRETQIPLVKLGTMGEYGTPNIDIEEGWLDIEHNGRHDRLLYPKTPGSLYHLSKVYDSDLLAFACRMWGLAVTDLNQGFVYGCAPHTWFWYDAVWGTALNRFVAQVVAGVPLTVYGSGGQTRGIINLKDTLQCIELVLKTPAKPGEFRVMNQFTETISIMKLAEKVCEAAKVLGYSPTLGQVENPRTEAESHYYNAANTNLMDLGLKPHTLDDFTIAEMIRFVAEYRQDIDIEQIMPRVTWR